MTVSPETVPAAAVAAAVASAPASLGPTHSDTAREDPPGPDGHSAAAHRPTPQGSNSTWNSDTAGAVGAAGDAATVTTASPPGKRAKNYWRWGAGGTRPGSAGGGRRSEGSRGEDVAGLGWSAEVCGGKVQQAAAFVPVTGEREDREAEVQVVAGGKEGSGPAQATSNSVRDGD